MIFRSENVDSINSPASQSTGRRMKNGIICLRISRIIVEICTMETDVLRIFVAGTGFTGSRIIHQLKALGHEVVGMNRRGNCEDTPGISILPGDVLSGDGLAAYAELAPFDLLISTLSGSSLRDPDAYRSLYVDGPRRIAEALPWRTVPKVWTLGSTGVYGESDGEWVTEEVPARPLHEKGQVQLDAEDALHSTIDDSCVLRLSGLYGPDRTRLVRQALRKRPFFKAEIWSNQIHGDDVAHVVGQLVQRGGRLPELLLVSDDAPTQRKEIFAWIREQLNCPDGLYDEDHPHMRGADRGNKRISNQRLRDLGVTLKYPSFREGLAGLLS